MTITTGVKLRPFIVPNFALHETSPGKRQDGFIESPRFALHELDDETLQALCDQFRDDVFAKAKAKREEGQVC